MNRRARFEDWTANALISLFPGLYLDVLEERRQRYLRCLTRIQELEVALGYRDPPPPPPPRRVPPVSAGITVRELGEALRLMAGARPRPRWYWWSDGEKEAHIRQQQWLIRSLMHDGKYVEASDVQREIIAIKDSLKEEVG